jgi:hypothetical protein
VAESIHEQIAAALRTSLAAITADGGTTYWYKPDVVARVTFFDEMQLDRGYQHVVLVRPGDEMHSEYQTGQCQANAEMFVLVARQFDGATENPYRESEPTRWQIANRCVRDVLRALWSDVTLGGLAQNIVADSLVVDRARYVAGWCLAELRFEVTYVYSKATP